MPWWAAIPAMGLGALAQGQGGAPGGGGLNQIFRDMIWRASNAKAAYSDQNNTANAGGGAVPQTFQFPRGYPTGPGTTQAFTTLMDILGQQGQTDPRAMNQLLSSIQRGTQTAQSALGQGLAMAGPGMQQSGVGQALGTAIGQAGEARKTQAITDEQQRAEERKRQDLLLWLQLMVDPSLTAYGIREGVAAQRAQVDAMNQGAWINALGQLGGAVIGNWGNLFGGGGGSTAPTSTGAGLPISGFFGRT